MKGLPETRQDRVLSPELEEFFAKSRKERQEEEDFKQTYGEEFGEIALAYARRHDQSVKWSVWPVGTEDHPGYENITSAFAQGLTGFIKGQPEELRAEKVRELLTKMDEVAKPGEVQRFNVR
ncbi:MAG: hypothetical protein HYT08_02825 [Candidatus Levybacteria bacterium]|nr:hypothetical protein [Candidatus Levybacteria bacterium]